MAGALHNKFGEFPLGAVSRFWNAGLEVAGAHRGHFRAALTGCSVGLTHEGVWWTKRSGDLRTGHIMAPRSL